jgi:hypothetical protein
MAIFKTRAELEKFRIGLSQGILNGMLSSSDGEALKNESFRERMAFLSVKMADSLLEEVQKTPLPESIAQSLTLSLEPAPSSMMPTGDETVGKSNVNCIHSLEKLKNEQVEKKKSAAPRPKKKAPPKEDYTQSEVGEKTYYEFNYKKKKAK